MKLSQCIKILRAHNKWRRGGNGKQEEPRIIGEAIDSAIELLDEQAMRSCETCEHKGDTNFACHYCCSDCLSGWERKAQGVKDEK